MNEEAIRRPMPDKRQSLCSSAREAYYTDHGRTDDRMWSQSRCHNGNLRRRGI